MRVGYVEAVESYGMFFTIPRFGGQRIVVTLWILFLDMYQLRIFAYFSQERWKKMSAAVVRSR